MRFILIVLAGLVPAFSLARDNGQYQTSQLKPWFDSLKNGKNQLCCSVADGVAIKDVDWDTQDNHYRVRIDGKWIDVPDDAVVTSPNRFGPAVVWPFFMDGEVKIRCFMAGAES